MSKDICEVYQKLCLRNQIPVDETILSCLYNSSTFGELNLSNNTITDISSLLIAKTLKLVSTIKILNLSNCFLSFNGLKNFLDVVNKLKQLSQLNLKRNKIENNQTLYISKILSNNSSITELQLDWNNIGASVDAFATLCNSLISNTVLKTLGLSNNNLCQKCGFHLANMLNINNCLKHIDVSWNSLGETGAAFLLKSLKNNQILTKLNIKGNSVSHETSTEIAEQLKHNQLNEMNYIPKQNLNLIDNVISDENLENQYLKYIDELQSKIRFFEEDNERKKQEIKLKKNNYLEKKESNTVILDQIEKIKSELSLKNRSLSSFIKQISNTMSNTDVENMNSLEDFEKIIYIIKKIEQKYNDKILKDTKIHQRLLENVSKFTNELNSIKSELKVINSSTEIDLINYSDELTSTKELLLTNMSHFEMANKINNEMHMKHLREQEQQRHASDEQRKKLSLLIEELKTIHTENIDLKFKLTKAETQSMVDTKTVRTFENSLILAKEELNKFNENQFSIQAAQHLKELLLRNDSLAKEMDILKMNLVTKDRKFQLCDLDKNKIINTYTNKLSTLQERLISEKQKLKEEKREHQKQIEDLYLKFSQYYKNNVKNK